MPVQVSISLLVIAVAVSATVTLFIGIVLGLLCGINICRKLKKTNSKQCFHTPEENVMRSMNGPVYEEVELEDKITNIDLSQNIAYEQVKKMAS